MSALLYNKRKKNVQWRVSILLMILNLFCIVLICAPRVITLLIMSIVSSALFHVLNVLMTIVVQFVQKDILSIVEIVFRSVLLVIFRWKGSANNVHPLAKHALVV